MFFVKTRRSMLRLAGTVLLVTLTALAQAQGRADIELQTDLNHMNITISPGSGPSGGCAAGQYWDIGAGRCTAAVPLRSESTARSCACSCGAGQTGSCTAQQFGSYMVYGWRLPPTGSERFSHNGPTSWGACQTVSSSCATPPPPPPPPPTPSPSTVVIAGNLICSASDPHYNWGIDGTATMVVTNTIRNAIIDGYKAMPSQRCPEAGDPPSYTAAYPYYVMMAGEYKNGTGQFTGAGTRTDAQTANWIKQTVQANAYNESLAQMDQWCQNAANATYGAGKYTATFIRKGQSGYTGKHCRLTPR